MQIDEIRRPILLLLAVAWLGHACTDSTTGVDCEDDEYFDPAKDVCVPKRAVGGGDDDAGGPIDASETDAISDTGPSTETGDVGGDEDTADINKRICDKDRDRSLSKECGGNDCDDNDPRRSPKIPERCDTIDNNCSGEVNDGLDCSFYAHEGETLYKVNPFQETARKVGDELPGLHDLDTHPDGRLYGITPNGFFRFDESNGTWNELRSFPSNASWVPEEPNGMAIGRGGTIYVTSKDKMYTIVKKEKDGEEDWWVEEAGTMGTTESGAPYKSSGDAVMNKRSLYMTSKHAQDQDHLVTLDRTSGEASDPRGIGHTSVFGLTTAWGTLYGLTVDGKLIEIDPTDGESSVVHTFEDRRWYGAASTPRRQPRRGKGK